MSTLSDDLNFESSIHVGLHRIACDSGDPKPLLASLGTFTQLHKVPHPSVSLSCYLSLSVCFSHSLKIKTLCGCSFGRNITGVDAESGGGDSSL